MSFHGADDPFRQPVMGKVLAGTRLNREDAEALYRSPDLLAIGELANYVCEQRHGNLVWCVVDVEPPKEWPAGLHARIDALLMAPSPLEVYEPGLRPDITGYTYLKDIAIARLLLHDVAHIRARISPAVPKVSQLALRFGADTLAGPDLQELHRLARSCGREPVK